MGFEQVMKQSDQIVPHDIFGLAIGAVMLLIALFAGGTLAILFIIISMVIMVGVAVDLTAHGWGH